MTPNAPPGDISPGEFFETWLPAEYERMRQGVTAPPNAVIGVELTGDDGGVWTLTLSGGTLAVVASAADAPDIALVQSVENWRIATAQAVSAGSDLATAASMERLLASPALGQLVRDVKGTIEIRIPGLSGRDFGAQITFGGASEPRSTITVDADTLARIRSGALPAPQAYFSGKIAIAGDPTLAMQVGMAFMS